METTVAVPQTQAKLSIRLATVIEQAQKLTITNTAEHLAAQQLYRDATDVTKAVKEYFEPMRKLADDTKKAILAGRDQMMETSEGVAEAVKKEVLRYEAEQEAIAKAQSDRINAATTAALESAALDEAQERQDAGDMAGAEEIIASVPSVAPVAIAPNTAMLPGSGRAKLWYGEVTNKKDFIRNCVEKGLWQFIDVNQVELNREAKDKKETFSMPGAVAKYNTSMRA